MVKQVGWKVALAVCLLSAAGCSKKSSNNNNGVAGTGFAGTGVVTAGTGVITAGTGVAGTGAAGAAAPTTVMCGTTTCMGLPAGASMFPGFTPGVICCDPATTTCGLMSGQTCVPRPMPNPKCPSLSIGVSAPGCCTSDGTTCGIDGYPLMAGCIQPPFPGLVTPTHCDGTPIMMAAAGMGGGGTGAAAGAGGAAAGAGGAAAGAGGHSGAGGATAGAGGTAAGAGGHSGAGGTGGAGGAAGH